jgi:hypothetical protein
MFTFIHILVNSVQYSHENNENIFCFDEVSEHLTDRTSISEENTVASIFDVLRLKAIL